MQKRLELKFYGQVQGVGFRLETQRKANELGLNGWVKNCADWTVEVVVEGLDQKLKEFLSWCYNTDINVDKIEVKHQKATGKFDDFSIIY
ncbi:acylphosphatase [Candidatus Falkowbacteria bacterium]|nr:acylphosphatase [Candidatus Falkowbacteria bacterium]